MEKNKGILIIDKDTDFVNELTNYLLAGGFKNIESTESIGKALTRLKESCFDIVLIDVFSPGMKGINYIQEIKCLNPEIKAFLMIEPEHQERIDEKLLKKAKFKCVIKSLIKQSIFKSIQ